MVDFCGQPYASTILGTYLYPCLDAVLINSYTIIILCKVIRTMQVFIVMCTVL
jgi:hypothetical protein